MAAHRKRAHARCHNAARMRACTHGYVCGVAALCRPYMAPEVFMAGHRHSFVADYYSLGITTYQFLLGQRPYKPDSVNMKTIVRMATFVPPEKYRNVRQIRKILISAQERKAPSPEFKYVLPPSALHITRTAIGDERGEWHAVHSRCAGCAPCPVWSAGTLSG
ncbi:hypothetical protein EON66_05345 [archaeon]|nr:MAG: hypothetical protein EON66_05345 [archaeon]